MNEQVKDCLMVCIDLLSICNELSKLEEEDNGLVDYTDVLTELRWNKNILNNRLIDLKK